MDHDQINDGSHSYVTMWTPYGNIIVRDDDPRLTEQTHLNERLNLIEERLARIEQG